MDGTRAFYNFVTLLFVALTVLAGLVVLLIASGSLEAPILAPKPTDVLPTLVSSVLGLTPSPFLATFTPSFTPPPTATPTPLPTETNTPTATFTITPTPTITYTPSVTPTWTPVPTNTMTHTPTLTPTFTPSPTFTFTPSPTGPSPTPTNTLSPYPFIVQQGTPILRENFANGAGCNWQGVAGQAVNATGEAIIGVQVRVSGDNLIEQTTITGTNTFYGPSGWEVPVAAVATAGRYRVSLWASGVQVSPVVEMVFPGSCQQNLALINFIQTRPF